MEYVNPRAQACQNCVKAKAKCYGHCAGKCERCNRLNRDCTMQAPVVRKRKTGKTTHHVQAERIAELEARLNNVVSVLSASQPSPVAGDGSRLGSSPLDPSNLMTPSTQAQDTTTPYLGPGRASLLQASPIEKGPDELLDLFRQNLARQVPFILIPELTTAEILAREKPFLYEAIIAAASYHDSVHQLALGKKFLARISENVVLLGNRNLDMLQGLMVYITWYNSLFHKTSQVVVLLGIALSMVIDLYLYVPSTSFEGHEKFLNEMKGIISCHQTTLARGSEPSREEKRVILGCFYLFSCVSTNFCRANPLHWTPYIQHCYDEIFNAPQNDNDVYLAHLAALQRISEDIKHSGIRGFPAQQREWNPAIGVQLKLLMSELQRFKVSLPASLQDDVLMLMHYHSVELYLFDIGFSMPPTNIAHGPSIQRADALLLCLKTSQLIIDLYFSVGSKPHTNFGPASTTQMYYVMMTLSKLSLFDAEDWDSSNLQTSMDLCALVERVAALMEEKSALYDVREDDKPWLQISKRMRLVKVRFERLLASENRTHDMRPSSEFPEGGVMMPYFMNQFDLLDDGFWQSLPGADGFLE
ncbi:uncharacterized protein LY89DRAFT_263864 [Mollisia scopiformis]|uniref:Zn(2)-C6 fungal-type domain-containing protein n=1 Tax=Mollisia scopiformis TaxID=149040 RepID=A0A132BE77_MOLSC|nr:uncharacterized protein LY89DRAFT_263864 [Mollisia scopiformis]KUJ10553.1 hypothetical protein LY89DRAFT_263864 [Mollisia scopiformis]